MIFFVIKMLMSAGISGKTADRIAKPVLIVLAILVGALLLFGAIRVIENRAVKQHKIEVEMKAAPAREEAADQRALDTIENTSNQKEREDAISAAPTDTAVSAPARALACERLRKLGRIPPACRLESTPGAETNSDR